MKRYIKEIYKESLKYFVIESMNNAVFAKKFQFRKESIVQF